MSIFTLPGGIAERIALEARTAGADLVETGGFVLVGEDHRAILALTGNAGISREEKLFVVAIPATAALFDWAAERDVRVAAQWHSHRYEAFLSETDLAHGFNVPDFRTTVVPNYEDPSADPASWGWWQFQTDEWVATAAPAVTDEQFSMITFEAGNVTEH